MNNKLSILFSTLLTVAVLCSQVSALGVGPAEFRIEKAAKGGEYQKTARIFNTDPTDTAISLTSSGEAASWITVYSEDDLSTPVERFTLAAQTDILLLLKLNIPDSAANGKYTGTIYVRTEPKGGEGAQPVGMQVPIEIGVEVIGEQILEGAARSITTRDVEINYPLEIRVEFENNGNVVARPKIDIDVKRDGETVGRNEYTADGVAPATWKTIPVELETSSLMPGNYTADVSVLLGEAVVATESLAFNILPLGTMTRSGAFDDLSYAGEPAAGKLLKIISVFRNTGKISTRANFVGEVYLNGELSDSIKSEELLVPVQGEEELAAYLKIESPGDYRITGTILYEGKKTDSRELSFNVPGTGAQTADVTQTAQAKTGEEAAQDDPLVLAGIAAVIILLAVLVYVLARNKKGAEKGTGTGIK